MNKQNNSENKNIELNNEHKKSHKSSDLDMEGYIFEKPRKRRRTKYKRKKKIQKILITIGIVILSLIILVGATFLILKQIGKNEMLDSSKLNIKPPKEVVEKVEVEEEGRIINYKDGTYKYNDDLTNILFMGIDKNELIEDAQIGTAGQADSLYLLSIDTKTGENKVMAISRETMTDIGVFTTSGQYKGTENKQICLSYAYGDGGKTSCENTVKAVSRLIYGVPINSYFSFDIDAISVLNDLVGGVQVTAKQDVALKDKTIKAGETVTLYGDDAETYVRGRDIKVIDSNNNRMDRQIQYIESYAKKALQMTKNDLMFPITLYNTASGYMQTDFSVSKVSYLATTLVENGNVGLDVEKVKGEVKQGEKYAEFYPDETKLFEQMLDIFYRKIN